MVHENMNNFPFRDYKFVLTFENNNVTGETPFQFEGLSNRLCN